MRRNVGRKPQTSANLAAFLHIIDTSRLLKALRNDKRAIFRAAALAQTAADMVLANAATTTKPEPVTAPVEPVQGAQMAIAL